jgi:carboxypeptidase family protein
MRAGFAPLALTILLGIVEPAFGQARTITGRVTDEQGRPVTGAAIEITSLSDAVVGFVVREQRRADGQKWRTTTNENGNYGVAVLVSGIYLVAASKEEIGTDQTEIVVGFGSVSSVNLRRRNADAATARAARPHAVCAHRSRKSLS